MNLLYIGAKLRGCVLWHFPSTENRLIPQFIKYTRRALSGHSFDLIYVREEEKYKLKSRMKMTPPEEFEKRALIEKPPFMPKEWWQGNRYFNHFFNSLRL